jgi:putative hemolysin
MLNTNQSDRSPFELDVRLGGALRQSAFSLVKRPIQRLTGLEALGRKYQQVQQIPAGLEFVDSALAHLNITVHISDSDLERIPKEGPVLVVANHPFGAIEGVILAQVLGRVRPDFRIMANYLLNRIPQMKPLLIAVDPFERNSSVSTNIGPLRESLHWLTEGGMLAMFPSGEVSHLKLKQRRVAEPAWGRTLARLVRRTGATVLPMFFTGRNSTLFQLAGLLHPRLRTALLPHELLNKQGNTVAVKVGKPVNSAKLTRFDNDRDLVEYVRMRTLLLMRRHESAITTDHGTATPAIIASDTATERMKLVRSDVNALPNERLLTSKGDYAVYFARMHEIPHLMDEIGRQRELTFRGAGEGSGNEVDLDIYDRDYVHLFAFDNARGELIGAYRIGHTDQVLSLRGMKGLYTSTLFKYKRSLMNQLNPALELGRSFVRPQYQREYAPLHLLWKGIGQYVVRHPQYHRLFGPVSMSSRYDTASQQLLVDFLKANSFEEDLARMVKPKTRVRQLRSFRWLSSMAGRLVQDIDEVSTLIAEIQAHEQGVPILFKHYLKLGGKILGFNLDPDFSDVLDGLILVDLLQTDSRILDRYLGKAEAAAYLAHHTQSEHQAGSL